MTIIFVNDPRITAQEFFPKNLNTTQDVASFSLGLMGCKNSSIEEWR